MQFGITGYRMPKIGLRKGGKKKIRLKFKTFWLDKKIKLWFKPNNNPILPDKIKFQLHISIHAFNYWFTDKLIVFMNQCWWENTSKASKVPTLPHLSKLQLTESCPCCLCAKRAQLFLLLWNPMDCSQPGSSVQGIFQARILEWVAISSSRGCFQSRDQTRFSCNSCIGRQILYHCATWEALILL